MDQSISVTPQARGSRIGIGLCLLSMFIFAAQDGITKTLVQDLPIAQLVMVRYWFFRNRPLVGSFGLYLQ